MNAIPTLYNGVQYRSRLEARWACLFDLLGWKFEYEPMELDGWIPDFLILGAVPTLVEVKPVTTFPGHIADEIDRSGAPIGHDTLIVGCVLPVGTECTPYHAPSIGWLAEGGTPGTLPWDEAPFIRAKGRSGPIGFMHPTGWYVDRITGVHEQDNGATHGRDEGLVSPDEIRALWKKAGNLTQWRGKQSVTA